MEIAQPKTRADLRLMSVDELLGLREVVDAELGRKIAAEKAELDQALRKLGLPGDEQKLRSVHRFYPRVYPKYRNPKDHTETWAGRGKQPRWLTAQLLAGKKLDDFRI